MAPFVVRRIVYAPVPRVWEVLTDFASHEQAAPLTRVITDPGEPGVGWSFSAVTGFGPGCFRDNMRIELWEPPSREHPNRPARYRLIKRGPVLGGWVNVQVTSLGGVLGPGISELIWTEELHVRLPLVRQAVAPVLGPVSQRAYGHFIDKLLSSSVRYQS